MSLREWRFRYIKPVQMRDFDPDLPPKINMEYVEVRVFETTYDRAKALADWKFREWKEQHYGKED